MSKTVVDAFKHIDIKHQDSESPFRNLAGHIQRFFQAFKKESAVRQPGQGVVQRLVRKSSFIFFTLRNIIVNYECSGNFIIVKKRIPKDGNRDKPAVL